MKKPRISITGFRERKTLVLDGGAETCENREPTNHPVSLDPNANTDIEKRRDHHERTDESNCEPDHLRVTVWFVPSTIDLGAIRKRLFRSAGQLDAGDAIDE